MSKIVSHGCELRPNSAFYRRPCRLLYKTTSAGGTPVNWSFGASEGWARKRNETDWKGKDRYAKS